MEKLRYKHISRTMSEINEEISKIRETSGGEEDALDGSLSAMLTEASVVAFCDWLCGLTDIPLSSSIGLAKFATESLAKGVPIEDVGEFVGGKLKQMVVDDLKKKSNDYNN